MFNELHGGRRRSPDGVRLIGGELTLDDEPAHHRNLPRPDAACLYGLVGGVARAGSENTEANPYAIAMIDDAGNAIVGIAPWVQTRHIGSLTGGCVIALATREAT